MEMQTIATFDPNEPYIYPIESHYTLRREMPISLNAKQFFQAAQSKSLEDILCDFDLSHGEVIEIDDGLQPYYFYYFGLLRLIPVPIFHPLRIVKNVETKEEN